MSVAVDMRIQDKLVHIQDEESTLADLVGIQPMLANLMGMQHFLVILVETRTILDLLAIQLVFTTLLVSRLLPPQ